jgi:hypothetical protein
MVCMKVCSRPLRHLMNLRGALPLASILLVMALLIPPVAVIPQESGGLSRIAPEVPLPEGPFDSLFLRHLPVGDTATLPVRIVRHGFPGSPVRPNMLDIPPDDGSFVELHGYDWLRVQGRPVEIRTRDTFLPLATLNANAQVLVIDETRIELLHGTVRWRRRHPDAPDFAVTVGSVSISGRGDATVHRNSGEVTVTVENGQMDISVDGETVALPGAGQSRTVTVSSDLSVSGSADFEDALAHLRTTLDTSLELIGDDTLTGSDLVELWSRVIPVAAYYSKLETVTDSSVPNPDIVMRDIAEAFRILGGFRFNPAGSIRRS